MGFMERQIEFGWWYRIDGPRGGEEIPVDVVGDHSLDGLEDGGDAPEWLSDYTENKILWSIEKIKGYGARMSAPGYMDSTDWCVFQTEKEAEAYLTEYCGAEDEEEAPG